MAGPCAQQKRATSCNFPVADNTTSAEFDRVFRYALIVETGQSEPRCSFCKKSKNAVDALIANPSDVLPRVYICDECVAVCQHIMDERQAATVQHAEQGEETA